MGISRSRTRVTLTILSALLFALCVAPAAAQTPPPDLTLTSPQPVTLQWRDNSNNEDGFVVERSLNGGPWEVLFASIGANVTSVLDATLAQSLDVDNVYRYRVKAFNTSGQSGPTNERSVKVLRALPPDPSELILILQQALKAVLEFQVAGGNRWH